MFLYRNVKTITDAEISVGNRMSVVGRHVTWQSLSSHRREFCLLTQPTQLAKYNRRVSPHVYVGRHSMLGAINIMNFCLFST